MSWSGNEIKPPTLFDLIFTFRFYFHSFFFLALGKFDLERGIPFIRRLALFLFQFASRYPFYSGWPNSF